MSSKQHSNDTGPNAGDRPVVLVVEDEPDIARTYELWLEREYDVRIASNGEEALERLDPSVDVALLDRMMPGMSGDEVLERMDETETSPQVAMVTAVDPDFDIIEMGFDAYVTKPPTMEEMLAVVTELLDRTEHAAEIQEYLSLLSKREALREELDEVELEESVEFMELTDRIEAAKEELADSRDRFLDDTEFVSTIRNLTDETDLS